MGNRHTKPGRLGFELGDAERGQEQGFAHIWKMGVMEAGFEQILAGDKLETLCGDRNALRSQGWRQRAADPLRLRSGQAFGCGCASRSRSTTPLSMTELGDWRTFSEEGGGMRLRAILSGVILILLLFVLLVPTGLWGQTDCEAGNGLLDFAPPKTMSVQEVIQKFGAAEAVTKEARIHYTYKQDVLVQTLSGKEVTGEFHEVTNISYDEKGKRVEEVTFAAQPSLRGVQLTQEDMEDIRVFMPLVLTSEDLPQYNLTYAGQQHVDDLDTYEFHVEPKKEEKGRRYFQGRIWVDAQDFQMVKVCGKSGPEKVQVKKHQEPDLRPTFVTYRQQVDGRYWLPAYTRSDDTLRFKSGPVHVRETIKYSGYKRASGR